MLVAVQSHVLSADYAKYAIRVMYRLWGGIKILFYNKCYDLDILIHWGKLPNEFLSKFMGNGTRDTKCRHGGGGGEQ